MTNSKNSGNDKPSAADQRSDPNLGELSIDKPRLTPQGRTDDDPSGEDSTNPMGAGAKQGQGDKAEG